MTHNTNKNRRLVCRSFWDYARRYPPIIVRLLAKRKPYGPPMSNGEIAHDSGLTMGQVFDLSIKLDWSGVDISTAEKFTKACRMDFSNHKDMARALHYLRKKPVTWQYLRRSLHWNGTFEPLINILNKFRESRK